MKTVELKRYGVPWHIKYEIVYIMYYNTWWFYVWRRNDDTYGSGTGQAVGKNFNKVNSSNFDATLPTKFFIHGWFGAGWNWYIRDMRREMLKYVSVSNL